MSGPVRWGIIGPGEIAAVFAGDLALGDGVLQAVASRSIDRAQRFADEHGAATAHGSYGALLADDEVDVVYIATPHRQHHAIALQAIAAGKHLLVEKAFTVTLAGTREVVAAAREAGVFCMEAMWTRFQPAILALREELEGGAIGEICSVRADLGGVPPYDPADRLWDPAQGGGALLDLGVYPVSFVEMLLGGENGQIRVDHVSGRVGKGGVDTEATIVLSDGSGRTAVAQSSIISPLPGEAAVFGTEGWIRVEPRFHHPDRIFVHGVTDEGRPGPAREIAAPPTGRGYRHEIDEVHRCLAEGLTESPTMPLDATVAVMTVLDAALGELGVEMDEATSVDG